MPSSVDTHNIVFVFIQDSWHESYYNATNTASACLHGTLGYVHGLVVELAGIELNVLCD